MATSSYKSEEDEEEERVMAGRRYSWVSGWEQGVCIKIIDAGDRDGVTAQMFQGKDLGSGHTQIRKKAQYDVL